MNRIERALDAVDPRLSVHLRLPTGHPAIVTRLGQARICFPLEEERITACCALATS